MELLEDMKLLDDKLTELCCDCSDMKDLLVVLSRGYENYDAVKMETQGTIDLLSKMQNVIADKCWDVFNDLQALIKKEAQIGNNKLDEDEEESQEEKSLLAKEIKGLMFALDHLLNAVEDKEIHIHP